MQLNMQMKWELAYLLHTLMHFNFSYLLEAPTVIFVGTVPAIFRSVANLGKGESIAWNSKYSENSLHFITFSLGTHLASFSSPSLPAQANMPFTWHLQSNNSSEPSSQSTLASQ